MHGTDGYPGKGLLNQVRAAVPVSVLAAVVVAVSSLRDSEAQIWCEGATSVKRNATVQLLDGHLLLGINHLQNPFHGATLCMFLLPPLSSESTS